MSVSPTWVTDTVLGSPFQQLTLPLGEDEDGSIEATLVRDRRRPKLLAPGAAWEQGSPLHPDAAAALLPEATPAAGVDVLYIHGWTDYFFNAELAEFWRERGARFFALDLRRYGRSLREGHVPGYIHDLTEYDAEIEAALEQMGHGEGERSRRGLIFMGHSTGGLIASLWASRHRGRLSALVLNSPWLELQTGGMSREIAEPLLSLGARRSPRAVLPGVDFGYYSRVTARRHGGEWEIDETMRPDRGFPLSVAWLRAILAGHAQVARGLAIDIPILVCTSDASTLSASWSEKMRSSDSVLSVEYIWQRSLKLGDVITLARIPGAIHDVVLSAAPVRARAYTVIDEWLRGPHVRTIPHREEA